MFRKAEGQKTWLYVYEFSTLNDYNLLRVSSSTILCRNVLQYRLETDKP